MRLTFFIQGAADISEIAGEHAHGVIGQTFHLHMDMAKTDRRRLIQALHQEGIVHVEQAVE